MLVGQALDGVDRTEHLHEIGPRRVEVERDVVTFADESVLAPGEPVAIDLIAVAEPGLDDPLAELDLADQSVHAGHQVVVDAGQMSGHDGAEQQAAEARGRVDRQHHVAERDPPRRDGRARVPDVDLGQQHRIDATDEDAPVLSGPENRA